MLSLKKVRSEHSLLNFIYDVFAAHIIRQTVSRAWPLDAFAFILVPDAAKRKVCRFSACWTPLRISSQTIATLKSSFVTPPMTSIIEVTFLYRYFGKRLSLWTCS